MRRYCERVRGKETADTSMTGSDPIEWAPRAGTDTGTEGFRTSLRGRNGGREPDEEGETIDSKNPRGGTGTARGTDIRGRNMIG